MLKLACSKSAETIVDVKSFLSNKKQKQNTWSPVQICCIVEMIAPLRSSDSWHQNTKKTTSQLLLDAQGRCFQACLVSISPSWCLEGFQINDVNTWTCSFWSSQHCWWWRGAFKRGRSWNVNTEKGKAPPFILPGLCHATVFHSSFFSTCFLMRQKEEGT